MATQELKIDFGVLAEIGRRGVRRAAAFLGMAHKAWTDEKIDSVRLDAPFVIQLLPDPMPKELADDVRTNFRIWVIGAAITELVQWLGRFAEKYYEIALFVQYHQKTVPPEAINRARKCVTDTNLHSKLERNVALGFRPPLLDFTESWTRARNTLAHNHGVVRERDFSPETDALTVNWRQFEFSIDGQKIENIIGHYVEKGGVLGFTFVDGSKQFKLGEQIEFTEHELLKICLTAFFQIDASINELKKHVEKYVTLPTEQAKA
jgi:hypothetical protein